MYCIMSMWKVDENKRENIEEVKITLKEREKEEKGKKEIYRVASSETRPSIVNSESVNGGRWNIQKGR